MTDLTKWRGLGELVGDAVDHGSRAIERVQLKAAERPFAILEQVPGISRAARAIHVVHDTAVATTYASVRLVSRAAFAMVELALSVTGDEGRPAPPPPAQDGASR